MNDDCLHSPEELKRFLAETQSIPLKIPKEERNEFIAGTLKRLKHFTLKRSDKSIVRAYLKHVSGCSFAQLTRLISCYQKNGTIKRKDINKHTFPKRFTHADQLLLVQTDECHQTLSGHITKKLFERAHLVFGDQRYKRLANISVSHIYNLRKGDFYKRQRYHIEKTKRSSVKIGERRKPQPNGKPGYIRIDTVHQGDMDKEKGVYHINAVDEVTQFEVICSVEKISEQYLIPVLETLLDTFPFVLLGFHSDNGSEYINRQVEKLLNKLHVEFTKSRSRQSNDNALAETKNGSTVRKQLGYMHIPQKYAPLINEFNHNHFVPYINIHRPCYFSIEKIDQKGKIKKVYKYENMMTPYDKLKSLPDAEQYLKPDITFEKLDQEAMRMTDMESAKELNAEREKLFKKIFP